MSGKEFLFSIRREQKEIEELKNRIYETEQSLLPGAIRYDRDKVQISPDDPMADVFSEIDTYRSQLHDKMIDLVKRRETAQIFIDKLDNSYERQVLGMYFLSVRRTRLSDVAAFTGWSERQTYRIYLDGLEHFGSKWQSEM